LAQLLDGNLELLGLVFHHAVLDFLWSTLDEILRLLQPEAREGSDFPDASSRQRPGERP
jgi:hypothetical protein